jgi:hypothetical protein
MTQLLNQDLAQQYRASIKDPIVRGLCTTAFTQLLVTDETFDGDFDVLFYTKMIHELIKDKTTLIKELEGGGTEHVFRD